MPAAFCGLVDSLHYNGRTRGTATSGTSSAAAAAAAVVAAVEAAAAAAVAEAGAGVEAFRHGQINKIVS